MWSDELDIHGQPPSLEGVMCQAFICSQHWYRGELYNPANVIYMRVSRTWHRLCLDYGIIFWSSQDDEPEPGAIPEIDAEYVLDDIGARLDLTGRVLESCEASAIPGGSQVCFRFEGGRELTFKNIGEVTTIAT